MRKIIFPLLFASVAFTEELSVAQVSEAMGHLIGKSLQEMGVDFDLEAIVKGLQDEQAGLKSPLSEDECVQAITNLQEEKIGNVTESELKKVDAFSNGDLLLEREPAVHIR